MEMLAFKYVCTQTLQINSIFIKLLKRGYVQSVLQQTLKNKIHPYQQIHSWKSLIEFSKELVDNVIYNNDGLVAINKPYGISVQGAQVKNVQHFIPNVAQYTINDALPHIAKQLNFPNLNVIQHPERYMTGVTLLAANPKIEQNVIRAMRRGNNLKTYWAITTAIPNRKEGTEKLALKWESNLKGERMVVIIPRMSKRMYKKEDVKVFSASFKVLSNSTNNLSSLLEIRSSTNNNHAVRLFVSTVLYSPILGDNLFGSRVKKLGNTYVKVDPFLEQSKLPPVLNKQIYTLLDLKPSQQNIIPVHIHLRSIVLPSYLKNKETLTIDAPIIPPLNWACEKFQFKCLIENRQCCIL